MDEDRDMTKKTVEWLIDHFTANTGFSDARVDEISRRAQLVGLIESDFLREYFLAKRFLEKTESM